ncbi:MAG TPA: hypothetical protein VNJ71_10430 [Gemmatimonadales bacterium]|nr:hypothetical protein [Gemmatimonadales bacterium]
MTPLVVIVSAALLAAAIVLVEAGRGPVRGQLDFLRTATAVYFLCFAVVPVYLQLTDPAPLRTARWSWMLRTPFTSDVFAAAAALGLVGYGALLAGYRLTAPWRVAPGPSGPLVHPAYLWRAGLLLGVVGGAALAIYTRSIGGVAVLLLEGLAFRGPEPPVITPWAFLKNVAPLVIGATFVFFALRQYLQRGPARSLATLVCGALYVASLVILFHQAGRAAFAAFLITLPLIRIVQLDRFRVGHALAGAAVFGFMVLFGTQLFQAIRDPALLVPSAGPYTGAGEAVRAVLTEFGFPHVTLANAIRSVPQDVSLRWFYDFPLAVVYLVPQRLTGLLHARTVTMINTELFAAPGAVPVDLLSLGYYSLGLPGAVLTCVGFGALLGLGERLLLPSPDPLRATLRVAWMLLLGFRVMYADPQLFWIPGFYLIVTTAVVLLPRLLRALLPVEVGARPIPTS